MLELGDTPNRISIVKGCYDPIQVVVKIVSFAIIMPCQAKELRATSLKSIHNNHIPSRPCPFLHPLASLLLLSPEHNAKPAEPIPLPKLALK